MTNLLRRVFSGFFFSFFLILEIFASSQFRIFLQFSIGSRIVSITLDEFVSDSRDFSTFSHDVGVG